MNGLNVDLLELGPSLIGLCYEIAWKMTCAIRCSDTYAYCDVHGSTNSCLFDF
jgi:hypothetical protein